MKNNKENKGDPCKATGCMADVVCGIWKSTSLFPVLLVYKDHAKYKLCIMRTDEIGQVQPEIHTLEIESENDYAVLFSFRGNKIKYNHYNDVLTHSDFGMYNRDCK